MGLTTVLGLVGTLCFISASSVSLPKPLSDAEIEYINSVQTSWKAGRNFQEKDLEYARLLLGVDMKANRLRNMKLPLAKSNKDIGEMPKNFDARKKWPNCTTIGEIRDQSACGSCWAFGAVEAMSDRVCIHTGKRVEISAEDLMDCLRTSGDSGCDGGFPVDAWEYYNDVGIVTGGLYGTKQSCKPYSLPPCDHVVHVKYKLCGKQYPTPKCTKECIAGYPKSYTDDKHFGAKPYKVEGVEEIMREIYTNGPVTASFDVYSDFISYKSGVYRRTPWSTWEGGHSVKIFGWGVLAGEDYWLVANSWNPDWGDEGFFKILKGQHECGIESGIVAGIPR